MFNFDKGYWLIRSLQLAFILALPVLSFFEGSLEVVGSLIITVLTILIIALTYMGCSTSGYKSAHDIGFQPHDKNIDPFSKPIKFKKAAFRCVTYSLTVVSLFIIPLLATSNALFENSYINNSLPLAVLGVTAWGAYWSFSIGFRIGELEISRNHVSEELRKLKVE